MSTMIQTRQGINNNVKIILNYLGEQYPCTFDIDEIEQDIATGYSDVMSELHHAYKALVVMKEINKNNSKKVSEVNKYLKMLMKENKAC